MDRLADKQAIAQEALKSLHELLEHITKNKMWSIDQITAGKKLDQDLQMARDSLVQRFEYSVDAVMKYTKEYLRARYGTTCEFSKDCARSLFKASLISEPETQKLLDMIDDRNLTSHSYLETIVNKIVRKIPGYCTLLQEILKKTI